MDVLKHRPDVVLYYGAGNTGKNIIDIAKLVPSVIFILYDMSGLPSCEGLDNVACIREQVDEHVMKEEAKNLSGYRYAVISDMSLEDKRNLRRERVLIVDRNRLHMRLVDIHNEAICISLKTRMNYPIDNRPDFDVIHVAPMRIYPHSPATSTEARIVGRSDQIVSKLVDAHEWSDKFFWYNTTVRTPEADFDSEEMITLQFCVDYDIPLTDKRTDDPKVYEDQFVLMDEPRSGKRQPKKVKVKPTLVAKPKQLELPNINLDAIAVECAWNAMKDHI
jgi:hypothetical protein